MSREALPQRVAARSPLAERSHSGEVGQSWSAFLVLSHGGKALASPPRGLDLASAAAVLTRGACKNVADSTIYYHGLVRVDRVGVSLGRRGRDVPNRCRWTLRGQECCSRVLGRVLTSAVNTSGGIAGFETPESLGASAHQYFVLDST